ncbi:hypothetical protein SAMN05660206_11297 [Sphingobacterium wenxiniae]|uniref:Uncharacterized protein n=2 Tax=Sphingobacterium wenxiniae TaxID=683125 RepID=A0A1I6VBR9_9SPHI|nr:hypothetical protein SAMN05660206_11297 [Sphingobacterium wenxiniae]
MHPYQYYMEHHFHIPVLGLAFSIDTPLKVAKFGISSVMSIVDDELIERMRHYYAGCYQKAYEPISKKAHDYRAKRITAYLNLVQEIVQEQIQDLLEGNFDSNKDLQQYFELLPEQSLAKKLYLQMLQTDNIDSRKALQRGLKQFIVPGDIDVNIMSKVDKINTDAHGIPLAEQFSDALSAIRGFAQSNLQSSVILSAGMNPRLYAYIAELSAFYPQADGTFNKRIILKVSDYRSALIQAKFLAKKGLWISEFRVESGLNCGGHAFATDGFLLGPILEEFKNNKSALIKELLPIYEQALQEKGISLTLQPSIKYTVQGGIGTANEQHFLLNHYGFDRTGWGSPFLLVPEATTVDKDTLECLVKATSDDFYVSGASPLGVPFNNFRNTSAERQRLERIDKGRPGSPCTKKYLVSNQEFTTEPICTASREYQNLKLKELDAQKLPTEQHQERFEEITEKICLCQGLATSAYVHYNIQKSRENTAVAICPGPNTVYFKKTYSLQQMVDHIYGRQNLLASIQRPPFFINELNLYVDHIKKYVETNWREVNDKKIKYLEKFKKQLIEGIGYYESLKSEFNKTFSGYAGESIATQLMHAKKALENLSFIK